MLQGDAIREITLEGPGAGGLETASAIVADMVTVVGTTGTGFLQNDACWRELPRLPAGELASPFYVRVEVADQPGVLALVALRLAAHGVSVARLVQHQSDGSATLHVVTHEARRGTAARRAGRDRHASTRRGHRLGAAGDLRPRRRRAGMGVTVTLGEGGTPLLPAPRLSERLGCELWLKWEGANPTGSFKDRGMALAVSRALERGAPGVICASTGNTAASAAAYAARAGLPAVILLPAGAVARGKLAQARRGRRRAPRDRRLLRRRAPARPAAGGRRGSGQRQLDQPRPDRRAGVGGGRDPRAAGRDRRTCVALPYGGGGNTCAYASRLREAGAGSPRLLAVQAAERRDDVRLGDPDRRSRPPRAGRGGGRGRDRSDDEILEWWRAIARLEGASASRPRRRRWPASRSVRPGGRVVCVLTGHGLKDPDAVERL